MLSGLTVARRVGCNVRVPLQWCPRADGRLGLFTVGEVRSPSRELISVPLAATLHRHQCCYAPAPATWRAVVAVASRTNFPAYFETKRSRWDDADADAGADAGAGDVDETSVPAALKERKWLEGASALFVASCIAQAQQRRAAPDFSSLPAVVQQIAWMAQCHVAESPLDLHVTPEIKNDKPTVTANSRTVYGSVPSTPPAP